MKSIITILIIILSITSLFSQTVSFRHGIFIAKDDRTAIMVGLNVGDIYYLSSDNPYGQPEGTMRTVAHIPHQENSSNVIDKFVVELTHLDYAKAVLFGLLAFFIAIMALDEIRQRSL